MDTKLELDIKELIDRDEEGSHIYCCINNTMMLCGKVDTEAEEDWDAPTSCNECDLREIEGYCPVLGHCQEFKPPND